MSEWGPSGGEMARRIRERDWSATPLGPMTTWPQSLKTALDLVLASGHAMQLAWGPERTMLYNDAYAPMLGERHPAALGQPFRTAWPDIWDGIAPLVDRVFAGETIRFEDMPLVMTRHGYAEDTWWNFSYSPVRGESGEVAGLLNVTVDATARIRAERAEHERERVAAALRISEERQTFLLRLADTLRPLQDPVAVQRAAMELLANRLDVMRATYFEVEPDQDTFRLTARFEREATPIPDRMRLSDFAPEMSAAYRQGQTLVFRDTETETQLGSQPASYRPIGVRAWAAVPLVKDGRLLGIVGVHSRLARDWSATEVQLIEDLAERTWANVERARTETALRESEERLRMALEAGLTGTWRFDLATGRQQWSEQQFRLFGLDPDGEPPTRELFLAMVLADDHGLVDFGPEDLAPDRGMLDAEFRIRRADGEIRWLVAHTVVRRNGAGEPIEMIGLNWDITERRRAAEHQQMLLFELQHRVRNTLAVIRSIIRRTAEATDDRQEMLMHLNGRIDAFARVQTAVTRDPARGVDLAMLIADELRAAGIGEGPRLAIVGPTIGLSPKAAETIGLAIHELATNAIKYGALAVPRGALAIAWSVAADAAEPALDFRWTETHVPGAATARRKGFGTEILTRTIPYELKATSDLRFGPDGVIFTMAAPMARLTG